MYLRLKISSKDFQIRTSILSTFELGIEAMIHFEKLFVNEHWSWIFAQKSFHPSKICWMLIFILMYKVSLEKLNRLNNAKLTFVFPCSFSKIIGLRLFWANLDHNEFKIKKKAFGQAYRSKNIPYLICIHSESWLTQ